MTALNIEMMRPVFVEQILIEGLRRQLPTPHYEPCFLSQNLQIPLRKRQVLILRRSFRCLLRRSEINLDVFTFRASSSPQRLILSLAMLRGTVQDGQFSINESMHLFKHLFPSVWKTKKCGLISLPYDLSISVYLSGVYGRQHYLRGGSCSSGSYFIPFSKGLQCQWGVNNFYTRCFQETICHSALFFF